MQLVLLFHVSVCDVLPLVLKSELPQVQPKQLIRWLQKSIEFYVCYVTQPPQAKSDTPLSPGPGNLGVDVFGVVCVVI
jgi:hypothetical protein